MTREGKKRYIRCTPLCAAEAARRTPFNPKGIYMARKSVTTRKAAAPPTAAKAAPAAKKPTARKIAAKARASSSIKKPAAVKSPAKKQKSAGKKQKTIRDSFNMPADAYALIAEMKKRAMAAGREIKKSELLRAGLKALADMSQAAFAQAIAAVEAIKTGRPVKKRK